MNDDVTRVTASTASEAARVLSSAFATDPVFLWMAGRHRVDPERFVPAFTAIIQAELRRDHHAVFRASTGGCVTLWHGVDQWKSGTVENVRTAPSFLRSFGFRRVPALLKMQAALERAHPPAPHHHLAFIGTDPSRQGEGLGAATLAPMLARCDDEGLPAYLESSNPRNEAFYARNGFVVTGRIDVPAGAPPVTTMWREPHG